MAQTIGEVKPPGTYVKVDPGAGGTKTPQKLYAEKKLQEQSQATISAIQKLDAERKAQGIINTPEYEYQISQFRQTPVQPTDALGQPISKLPAEIIKNQELINKINQSIQSGDIQGFSGKLYTDADIAKANLLNKLIGSEVPQQYGEYYKGVTPQGINLLKQYQQSLPFIEQLPKPFIVPREYEKGYIGSEGSGKASSYLSIGSPVNLLHPISSYYKNIQSTSKQAFDITLALSGFKAYQVASKGIKPLLTVAGLYSSPIVSPILSDLDKSFLYQPTSKKGKFGKAFVESAIIKESPFLLGVYGGEFARNIIIKPEETIKSMIKNYPETLGFIAGGGLKIKIGLPKVEMKGLLEKENLRMKNIMKSFEVSQIPDIKLSYEIPFTAKNYELDLLKGEYGREKLKIPPEHAQLKDTLEKLARISKGAPIDVGVLRLERLKDLPKDTETLNMIKDFVREKGLWVGGSTAIESLTINGIHIDLRRIPRDLELYDPRTKGLSRKEATKINNQLANELFQRLKKANKKVSAHDSLIRFEGIEGHGVNFQDFNKLNLERYRFKKWINPEGIIIADPLSMIYNKVVDLLKRAKIGTKKGEEIKEKLGIPELIKKATLGKFIYSRYPKDLSHVLSTYNQIIEQTLKKYSDFTKRQIPLYQEYMMLRFGQAKELIKPYLSQLKYEEVPVKPYIYTGEQAGFFSGVKHIESYTKYLQKRLLEDTRASTISKIKTSNLKENEFYHGTKLENVKSILKDGLKKGDVGWLDNAVFLTKDIEIAKFYGNKILKITLTKEQMSRADISFDETILRENIKPYQISSLENVPKLKSDYYYINEKGVKEKVNYPIIPIINYDKLANYPKKESKLILPSINYPKRVSSPEVSYPAIKFQNYPNYPTDKIYSVANYPKIPEYPQIKTESYPNIANYPKEIYPTKTTYPPIYPPTYPRTPIYPPTYPRTPISPIYPTEEVKKILPFEQRQKIPIKKSLGEGYNVYGKKLKSNQYLKINSIPVTKSRAEDIGSYYVDNTLARSFKVIKTNRKAEDDYQFMFIPMGYYNTKRNQIREYKIRRRKPIDIGQIYIEKEKYLLNTPEEKRKLKEFRNQVKTIMR